MLFYSLAFLIFFSIVFPLYWISPTQKIRIGILLIASCIFYMWWNPYYILLILFSSVVDFFAGAYIVKLKKKSHRLSLLAVSLCVNLSLLFLFKYSDFFIETINQLAWWTGSQRRWQPPHLLLPVGISFYTFQTMSYTIDVYQKDLKPRWNFLTFALFVSFFPQLVAGPIVRAKTLLPQFDEKKKFDSKRSVGAIWLFILGLTKKVAIGDSLAQLVDPVFTNPGQFNTSTLWLAMFAYGMQIYCDFSGYSDMAIALGRLFGFEFPENFNMPYIARNPQDFWRRWHISLSTWFRDYVYLPMGGNQSHHYFNLLVTMLVAGFWHGANWTFLAWGLYHGILLCGFHFIHLKFPKPLLPKAVSILITYLLVHVGWVFFRAPNMHMAWEFLLGLMHPTGSSSLRYPMAYFWISSVFIGYFFWDKMKGRLLKRNIGAPLQGFIFAGIFLILMGLLNRHHQPFIYFQF